jgi:hypothetical protein
MNWKNFSGVAIPFIIIGVIIYFIVVKIIPLLKEKRYTCDSSGSCVEDPGGTYTTSNCNSECTTIAPPSGYNCVQNSCIASARGLGTYTTLEECNNVCGSKKYKCKEGNCVEDPDGTYTDSNCNNECNSVCKTYDWTPWKGEGVDNINSACPCSPKDILSSGILDSGNNTLYFSKSTDGVPPGTNIGMNIMNTCDRPLYIFTTATISPEKNAPRYMFINQRLDEKKLYRFYFQNEELIALVSWVFYFTDENKLLTIGSVPLTFYNAEVGDKLPITTGEPQNPGPYVRFEATVMKNNDNPNMVTCGGNLSYVDQTTIPALAQFGPAPVTDVDEDADPNTKLVYTTCSVKELMDKCPTLVKPNSKDGDYGMCPAPQHICKLPDQFEISQSGELYQKYCSNQGLLCPIINAFNLKYTEGGINPNYFNSKADKTFETPDGNGLPISGIIYGESNPFGGIYPDGSLEPFYIPNNPSLFNSVNNPDVGQEYPDRLQQKFKSDADAYGAFVGTINENGEIDGYGKLGGNVVPSNDIKVKAFNSVNNSWAVARGMCDPNNPTTMCGGQGGDYFVKDPKFPPGYTKRTANLETPDNWYRNKEFPHNPYAKYVTEHTHYIYGFPYDEGLYGGFSTSQVDTTKFVPQLNLVLCPECKQIDISGISVEEVIVPLVS